MSSLVIYGFTAGAVATVNPCGFALLPAWFAREMATHEGRPAAERMIRCRVALNCEMGNPTKSTAVLCP